MGCAVNGPGEAKHADFGIAGGINEGYIFKKGDFYIIRPNTIYIQKSLEGTELMFIKVPGMNDKVKCDITDKMKKWFEINLCYFKRRISCTVYRYY